MRLLRFFITLGIAAALAGCGQNREDFVFTPSAPVPVLPSSGLPLPSTVSRTAFEEVLYAFIGGRKYREFGWRGDKRIRDTGPFRNGEYYGTHPAVKIYYSPEVISWLEGGRQSDLPDGSMIIKEMYQPPAVRYDGKAQPIPNQWTVMVRDKNGSQDGWFWSYYSSNPDNTTPAIPQQPDSDAFPFNYPDSGFGLYCVRCHGSADNTLTFASTDNIEGFPGQPMVYAVDDSWMTSPAPQPVAHPNDVNDIDLTPAGVRQALADGTINAEFLAYFDQFPAQSRAQITPLPPVTTSHVVAKHHNQFTTSDQCMSCHAGDNSPFGPNMIKDDTDISPFGEWDLSMMGLAGRDPIFYAQLESEFALHAVPGGDFDAAGIANFCFRCHGAMGQRQYTMDNPGQLFSIEKALAQAPSDPNHEYGGLARDGVSCMVCHQIQDQSQVPFSQIETGLFVIKPAVNGLLSVFGPFDKPTVKPMQQSLAMTPVKGEHVKNSLLCASCHTVKLPVLNQAGKTIDERYEQSTYFEWQNSSFNASGPSFKSCQDCHMPNTFHDSDPLEFKIANVQDQDFPLADGVSPVDEITVNPRPGFARHQLSGINVFALELFRQYPDILGIRTKSFMTGFSNGIDNSIANSLDTANNSARLDILSSQQSGGQLETRVKVTNLAGHRFPSGVGFRRLLLQLVIKDRNGAVVWSSGRTNSLGLVVDAAGNPLPSEVQAIDPVTGKQAFEPHHQVVDSQNQAQIYAELILNTEGKLTTSFLDRATDLKDNRLMPQGWSFQGPPGMDPAHVEATDPVGEAARDADFTDGTGSDIVSYRATLPAGAQGPFTIEAGLFYQAIPPAYLNDRFNQGKGPNTKRLHYMTSRLDLSKTSFPDWKLPVASGETSASP